MKKILLVITVAAILSACGKKPEGRAAKQKQLQELKEQAHNLEEQITALAKELSANEEQEVVNVKVRTIKAQKFEHFIDVTGKVEAVEDVDVSPESAGVIKDVLVTEGQRVSKGQVLARLNTEVLSRTLDELNIQLDLAKTTFERQKRLWNQNIGSEMEFLQAKNSKESLEKKIQGVQSQIEMAKVKSPINGVVDVVYQKKGNIGSPQSPFAKVINTSSIKVYGDISESYITKIAKGDKISVIFPALNDTVKARINEIGNTIDPDTRTFRVRVNLRNKNNYIKPNLISIISLCDYDNESAIVIPSLYIREDSNGHFIYVVKTKNENKTATKVYITLGMSNNNMTEITNGLKPGMQIISEGYNQVSNGTGIQIN